MSRGSHEELKSAAAEKSWEKDDVGRSLPFPGHPMLCLVLCLHFGIVLHFECLEILSEVFDFDSELVRAADSPVPFEAEVLDVIVLDCQLRVQTGPLVVEVGFFIQEFLREQVLTVLSLKDGSLAISKVVFHVPHGVFFGDDGVFAGIQVENASADWIVGVIDRDPVDIAVEDRHFGGLLGYWLGIGRFGFLFCRTMMFDLPSWKLECLQWAFRWKT